MNIKRKCFVPSCRNGSEKTPKKLFILLPADKKRRDRWYAAVNKNFIAGKKGKTATYCCEDHFKLEEDIENWMEYKTIGTRLKFKPDVVPHLFIANPIRAAVSSALSQISSSSKKRKLSALQGLGSSVVKKFFQDEDVKEDKVHSPSGSFQIAEAMPPELYYTVQPISVSKSVQVNIKSKMRSVATITDQIDVQPMQQPEQLQQPMTDQARVEMDDDKSSERGYLSSDDNAFEKTYSSKDISRQVNYPIYKNVGVQVIAKNFLIVANFLKTDEQLYALTGLPSFSLLTTLVSVLARVEKDTYEISLCDQVLLTFIKLKLNLSYSVLSKLFSSTGKMPCKNIFLDTISRLVCIFSQIQSPLGTNLPESFQNFNNVGVVIDCFELPIHKSKGKTRYHSKYKDTATIKFLIGVTPTGLISYISVPVVGSVSNKTILQQSGLLQSVLKGINPGEDIMVDDGLFIDEAGIILIKSVALKEEKFSQEVGILNAKIASARVCVERTIQRLRDFQVLKNLQLIEIIGDICKVICGIVNLSAPLLPENGNWYQE